MSIINFEAACIGLVCLVASLTSPAVGAAAAKGMGDGDWVLSTDRAVQQEGLTTRVCTDDPADIRYCLEFQWRDGYLELWGYGTLPSGSGLIFKDWSAPTLDLKGKYYRPLNIDDVESPVAVEKLAHYVFSEIDKILCKEPPLFYLRGDTWVAWRMTTGSPDTHRTDKRALYYKLINARKKLLKGRKFGIGYQFTGDVEAERQYSIRDLAELLQITFAEAVAAEPEYGPHTIDRSPPVIPPPSVPDEGLPDTQWILIQSRSRPQPGLEHRLCALEANPLALCFEFHWHKDRLELWPLVVAYQGSGIEFAEDKVPDIWVDSDFRGNFCKSEPVNHVNWLIALDNFTGHPKNEFLIRSETVIFWREDPGTLTERHGGKPSLYKQLSEGKVLTVLHYLKDGTTMPKAYNLSGIASKLSELFEEAKAAAPMYRDKE